MHDLKAIRDDPSAFDEGLRRRGLPPQAAAILEIDQDRRRLQQALEEMQARRNAVSKEIGGLRAKGQAEAAAAAAAEVTRLKESMPAAEQAERERGAVIEALLATIPNLPAVKQGRSVAVVCSNFSCMPPIEDPDQLARTLHEVLSA